MNKGDKASKAVQWLFFGFSALSIVEILALRPSQADATKGKTVPKKPKEPDFTETVKVAAPLAERLGVPLSLALSVFSIESGFNRKAENHSPSAETRGGAWGLGQITLATAKDMAARFPNSADLWPRFDGTGQSLLDLQTNIGFAIHYLARAYKRYGDWLAAGASYHQGMGKIDQLRKTYGSDWANHLPPKGKLYVAALRNRRERFEADAAYS